MASLPAASIVHKADGHVLLHVSRRWFALVGPDDSTDEVAWVQAMLPSGPTSWWVEGFQSYDRTLVTHFCRAERRFEKNP